MITATEIASLNALGFAQVTQLVSAEHATEVRRSLERLFIEKAGYKEGNYGDLTPDVVNSERPNSPQIHLPSNYDPFLSKSLCFTEALSLARQILGPGARFVSDVAIYKQPRNGAATPWHQDEAFRDPRFLYSEITIWLALQDVDARTGCLKFIPGSHKSCVHYHRTPGKDLEALALECVDGFDERSAVLCPLRAGSCTIHFSRTVHGSTPNLSENARIGYAMTFGIIPIPSKCITSFPWLDKRTPQLRAKRKMWLRRGGWVVAAWRRLGRGDVKNWEAIRYLAVRAIRTLSRGG